MRTRRLVVSWGMVAACVGAAPVHAQHLPDRSDSAHFRLGPVAFTPKLSLHQVGVDTNIYNRSQTPQRDVTATASAGVDVWFRVGPLLASGRTVADGYYFQKATSQRSVHLSQDVRIDVDLARVVPRVGGALLRSRQRPNDEFDARIEQRHSSGFAGVLVPFGGRGRIEVEAQHRVYDYSSGAFGDAQVATALNRTSRALLVTAGVDVTPLTRAVVRAEHRTDVFRFTPGRDSRSVSVMPGVAFEPSAIVSGSAFIGYRRFETPSAFVPDVAGLVAAVELRYLAADRVRITGQVSRDVDYSLDPGESVYVASSAGLEVVQAVGSDWDVVGRVRRASLRYQPGLSGGGRTDRVWQGGGGLGRHVAELRIGLDVDYVSRESVRPDRGFDGWRVGASISYGY